VSVDGELPEAGLWRGGGPPRVHVSQRGCMLIWHMFLEGPSGRRACHWRVSRCTSIVSASDMDCTSHRCGTPQEGVVGVQRLKGALKGLCGGSSMHLSAKGETTGPREATAERKEGEKNRSSRHLRGAGGVSECVSS
jgi:hypothetical protein